VPNLSEKYRSYVPERVAHLNPPIAPPIGKLLNEKEQQQILDLEKSLMSDVSDEVKREIRTYIKNPVDQLLDAMKNNIEKSRIKWMKSWIKKKANRIVT